MEQKEIIDSDSTDELMDGILGNKVELVAEGSQFISDDVEGIEQNRLEEEQSDEYISIYSGRALKSEELFYFSAKEDVNMVLVAGPYASGKTTLIIMLYRLFLKGYNKKLFFAGSKTMEGFRERSENLLYKSGQSEPFVARTSRAAEDRYLHLSVLDEERRKENVFFADVSGETFSDSSGLKMMAEDFSDSENVIVVIDGEKVCDASERNGSIFAAELLLRRLLNKKIITKRTKLQIVYTKKDKIDACEKKDAILKYLKEKEQNFINNFKQYVYSVKCIYLSALSEEPEECKKLEQILQNCMEIVSNNDNSDLQTIGYKVIRNFDKFQVRECV